MFVLLLCIWHISFCTNIGLEVKSRVLTCQILKPMTELLKPMLENHKSMIAVIKTELEFET